MSAIHLGRAALVAVLFITAPLVASAADVTVFAAASLTDALQRVADGYKTKNGRSVALSFAASSALARQIEASGGADIFISADKDWMDYLDNNGLIAHASRRDILGGTLVLIAPASSKVRLKMAPHFDLVGALGDGRLSIADPDSVPAGKYAKAALTALGVWNTVADRLAVAENVRVALAYVTRGEAPLGIVYSTDAIAEPNVKTVAEFPDNTHPLIVYPAALTKDAKPAGQAFLDYLEGPQARAIFTRAGFVVLTGRR
jgi:molybdate transport system substrate-binding protein